MRENDDSVEIRKSSEGDTIFQAEGAVGKKIYSKHGCDYVHLTIQPGSKIARHLLGIPVTFVILNGVGILQCQGESNSVEPGDIAEGGADIEREWSNAG